MKNEYLYLLVILLAAIILRAFFFVGHVYSDDSYYSYLSYTITQGNFGADYFGYPINKLRVGHLYLTAFFYKVFGINEFATVFPVFLFSIGNIFIAYKIGYHLTNNTSVALITSFIISIIPTEIIFASISFVDLQSAVLINIGMYFYLIAKEQKEIKKIYLALFFWGLSFLFKETIYFFFFVFLTYFIYEVIKKKNSYKYTLVVLIGLIAIPILEGLVYYIINNDFFYRFHITQENYLFAYYDFFPNTVQNSGEKSNFLLILEQIIQNFRFIFLRRFYLFLPLLGLFFILIRYRNDYQKIVVFWFIGLIISMSCLSVSINIYQPLNLKSSWYLFPVFLPSAFIVAYTLNQFVPKYKFITMTILFTGSIYMSNQYLSFFQKSNLNEMKDFLESETKNPIYTDHHTKYGVDHVSNYSEKTSTYRILGEEFSFDVMPANSLLLYNKKHIDELRLQGFSFPNFNLVTQSNFKLIKTIGDFKFYKKL